MSANQFPGTPRRSAADFDLAVENGVPQTAEPSVVAGHPVVPEHPVVFKHPVVRYLDVVAPLVAAPIALVLGAPAVGYGLGAATWIVIRVLGAAAGLRAVSINNLAQLVSLRLTYRFTRVSLLVAVTVVAFKDEGRADGLAALLVITFAYTIHLSLSIIRRPRLFQRPDPSGQ